MKIKQVLISNIFRPKIIIYGAENNKIKVQAVMDFYDKYNDYIQKYPWSKKVDFNIN